MLSFDFYPNFKESVWKWKFSVICFSSSTAIRPNLDSYVFLRVIEDTDGVLVEEETLDTGWVILMTRVYVADLITLQEMYTSRILFPEDCVEKSDEYRYMMKSVSWELYFHCLHVYTILFSWFILFFKRGPMS